MVGVSVVNDRTDQPVNREFQFQSAGGTGAISGYVERERVTGIRHVYDTNVQLWVLQKMEETILVKSSSEKDPEADESWASFVSFVDWRD